MKIIQNWVGIEPTNQHLSRSLNWSATKASLKRSFEAFTVVFEQLTVFYNTTSCITVQK